jgi:membrane complex biogenesis BtpA family protein
MFNVDKPVIAMVHLPALPGTPRYDPKSSISGMLGRIQTDIHYLLDGGVDGLMYCNEDDRPYSFRASMEGIAVMTRLICETCPRSVPFGVDYLWDAKAALAIARASGAAFVREVVSGVYESDMGLWSPDAGEIYRYRKSIDAEEVRIFANITPEFASPLGTRSVAERAKSVVFSSLVDAILISGSMAGSEPDIINLIAVKQAVGDQLPLFLNTGAKVTNVDRYLQQADGVIVGSSLKVDGSTWNPVDPKRVKAFMDKVRLMRSK